MEFITVNGGQSVKDVAVQYYGSSFGVWDILKLNPEVRFIDQNLIQGQKLWIDKPSKKPVVNRLKQLGAVPSTAALITINRDFSNEFSNEFE